MKKALSLMLSLVIVISLFSGVDFTAQAEKRIEYTHEYENKYETAADRDKLTRTDKYIYDHNYKNITRDILCDEKSETAHKMLYGTFPISSGRYGDFYYEIVDNEVTIIEYVGQVTTVIIPSSISGYPVTTIGEGAFAWSENLRLAVIPDTVKTIKDGAFQYCANLTEFSIPKSVVSFGVSVFYQSYNLEKIFVDKENDAFVSIDGVMFTKDSKELVCYPNGKINDVYKEIYVVPDGTESIREYAFEDARCNYVMLPDSLMKIGDCAFSYSNIKDIIIPTAVKSIGAAAFAPCFYLESISVESGNGGYASLDGVLYTKNMKELISYPAGREDEVFSVPDGVSIIREYAFLYSNLWTVSFPSTLKIIGEGAFALSYYLSGINFSSGLETIDDLAFANIGCEYVDFPDTLKTIGDMAFANTPLRAIHIPASVRKVDEYSFEYCYDVSEITVDRSNEYFLSSDGVLYDKKWTTLLYYPPNKKDSILDIPESVEIIKEFSLEDATQIGLIILHENIKEIGFSNIFTYMTGIHILYPGTKGEADSIIGVEALASMSWHYSCPYRFFHGGLYAFYEERATCTSIGYKMHLCPVCSQTITTFSHMNHDTARYRAIRPTHERDGRYAYYTCVNCHKLYSDLFAEHEINISMTVDPAYPYHAGDTVYDNEYHWVECHYCDLNFDIEEHSYGEWIVLKEPTKREQGKRLSKCDCGYICILEIPSTAITGDINMDDKVDGIDSGILLQIIAGWDLSDYDINLDLADVNGDGSINGTDSGLMLQYLAGWFDEFPV